MQLSRSPVRTRPSLLAALLVVLVAACSSQIDGQGPSVAWSPADDGWQSGIAIAALPNGFALITNVGNEVSVGHRFEDGEGRHLEVFRLLDPESLPVEGDPIETSNGITYYEASGEVRTQVFFETQGVRLGASSSDLSVEEVLTIARSITYNPGADELSG